MFDVLFVSQERKREPSAQFFRLLKADKYKPVEYAVSDMWRNYLDEINATSRDSAAQPDDSAGMAVTGRLPAIPRIQPSGMGRKGLR